MPPGTALCFLLSHMPLHRRANHRAVNLSICTGRKPLGCAQFPTAENKDRLSLWAGQGLAWNRGHLNLRRQETWRRGFRQWQGSYRY